MRSRELYLGLPDSLEHRYATMRPWLATPEQQAVVDANWVKPDSIAGIAYNLNANPPTDQVRFINTREVRALGQASAAGVGNARGLAALYVAAVGEFRGRPPLLKPDTIAEFATVSSTGADLVTGVADTRRRFAFFFSALENERLAAAVLRTARDT